jgi:hypothetical protein
VTANEQEYARLLRRFGAVQEIDMRVALWREFLQKSHPDDALSALRYIMAAHGLKSTDAYLAMLAFSRLLLTERGLVEKSILAAAVVSRCDAIVDLVTERAAAREMDLADRRTPNMNKDREVTLGERRFLARSRDRNIIDRLLRDPDEGVIRNLLQNSRVLERDVLLIASTQPISGAVLETIFRSDRWCNRREVQLALLQNPYTPTSIAGALVELMDEAGLRCAAGAQSIEPIIMDVIRRRLRTLPHEDVGEEGLVENPWVLALLERRDDGYPIPSPDDDEQTS